MNQSIQIDLPEKITHPAQILLALALELRQHIHDGRAMTVVIPKKVYAVLNRTVIEEILYDHLLTVDSLLEERLTVLIKPVTHIAIEWPLTEK
jgi:hypothetical protein